MKFEVELSEEQVEVLNYFDIVDVSKWIKQITNRKIKDFTDSRNGITQINLDLIKDLDKYS